MMTQDTSAVSCSLLRLALHPPHFSFPQQCPHTCRLTEPRLHASAVEAVRDKIIAILKVAEQMGHDGVVLSALGCGAFHNPPTHIAELFKEALDEMHGTSLKRFISGLSGSWNKQY
eukprot:m.139525 g.139525  ORF g.139525 m.139525 type:complete len:116 (+) comp17061_c0_seq2:523-870(+)